MNRFIKDYIIRRNNFIINNEDDYLVVADKMSLEDYLKRESRDCKIGRFFFMLGYFYPTYIIEEDDCKIFGFTGYICNQDNNEKYDSLFLEYILNNCLESDDVYEKLMTVVKKYKGKKYEDCKFYDSDDSEDQDLPEDYFDNEIELDMSNYVMEFIELHNFKSHEEIKSWMLKSIDNYFDYLGLDVNIL